MKKKLAITAAVVLGILLIAVIANPFLLTVPMVASGLYEVMRGGTPFDDAHARAVTTFVESEGFGITRIRKAGLWNEHTITYDDKIYYPHEIRLIGTTPEFGPRLFPDRYPPRKEQISDASSRELSADEQEAIERLSTRRSQREELPPEIGADPNLRRVIAPIFASQDCLRCHSVKVGEMLGAFDYVLMPSPTRNRAEQDSAEQPATAPESISSSESEPST